MTQTWGRRVRYACEYAGARLGTGLLARAPLPLARAAARVVADLSFTFLPTRRRTSVDNILACDIVSGRRAARALARASFRHFAVSAVEAVRFRSLIASGAWRAQVDLRIPGGLTEAGAGERPRPGAVLACGHFGNWMVAGHVLGECRPLVGIRRPLHNARVDALVAERVYTDRFRSLPSHDAHPLRFVEVLRRGDVLALMIDQHGGRRGVQVEFMGRPALSHGAVAMLPLITGAPLYFGWCRRAGPMRFACEAIGPLPCERTGRRDDDVRRILARLNAELERLVRTWPEQFMWGHRRWRPGDARYFTDEP